MVVVLYSLTNGVQAYMSDTKYVTY